MNLKELYGDKYRIRFDPAVGNSSKLKADPDYQIIPCRHGEIYPRSATLLAVWVKGCKRIGKMKRELPELKIQNDGEGEAIFLFKPEIINKIAEYVKPYRKRHATQAQLESLKKAQAYLFKAKQAR